ncbi:MAG: class I SAM-dependent methyltransferase [Patescibacteria group bacterium]|nr:class I SAM-dependent methyltransferase [Patescibacteria group bacterium]
MKFDILRILDYPFWFNSIRYIITGNQKSMKAYVYKWLSCGSPDLVLDIGCGTGDFFDKRYKEYIGIDINQKFIAFAKKKYKKFKNANFLVGNVLSYKYRSLKGKKVGIIFVSMMHHLSDQELFLLFDNLKKLNITYLVVCDIIPNPKGLLKKLMVTLDRGAYIRSEERKIKILKKYFYIIDIKMLKAGLAVQCGIVCKQKE